MSNFISEDQIEQALMQKLQHLHGFDVLDCHTDNAEDLNDGSNRASKRDVILIDRLREAVLRLNPDIPREAIEVILGLAEEVRLLLTVVAVLAMHMP